MNCKPLNSWKFAVAIAVPLCAQNPDTLFHHINFTDGPPEISRWNTKHKDNVMEIVDAAGRVTEIMIFGSDGKSFKSDCYLASKTIFKYDAKTITVENYTDKNILASGIECGPPAKSVYYLSAANIDSCKTYLNYAEYFADSANLDRKFLRKLKLDHAKYGNESPIKTDCSEITGYEYSMAKFNGIAPKQKRK